MCRETTYLRNPDVALMEEDKSYDNLPKNLIEDVDSYMSIMTKGGFIGSK